MAALWYVRHLHYPGLIGRFFAYRHSGTGKYFLRPKEEIRGGLEGHSRCSMCVCVFICASPDCAQLGIDLKQTWEWSDKESQSVLGRLLTLALSKPPGLAQQALALLPAVTYLYPHIPFRCL